MIFRKLFPAKPSARVDELIEVLSLVEAEVAPVSAAGTGVPGKIPANREAERRPATVVTAESEPRRTRGTEGARPIDPYHVSDELAERLYDFSAELRGDAPVFLDEVGSLGSAD
jgi:hypothetical protein